MYAYARPHPLPHTHTHTHVHTQAYKDQHKYFRSYDPRVLKYYEDEVTLKFIPAQLNAIFTWRTGVDAEWAALAEIFSV
jgi:hypothetical protein